MPEQASLPPPGLVGLRSEWSRLITAPDHRGVDCEWHVLDTGISDATRLTVLCVHGNPTWSYIWRDLLDRAPGSVRVVAVDQLDMGYSERTEVFRRLGDRVADLRALTEVIGIEGPVITVAHDWGGPISLGWALEHHHQLAGVVLCNTAVHQPADAPAPPLIRAARHRRLHRRSTVDSKVFVTGTAALSQPPLDREVRHSLAAPYGTPERRRAIGDFVDDIPLEADHPSRSTLDEIAARLTELGDVPALLLWGPRDPVFGDRYLHDLEERLPHAAVHRFVTASHLVPEDADAAGAVFDWIEAEPIGTGRLDPPALRPILAAIDERRRSPELAITEFAGRGRARRRRDLTFADFTERTDDAAAALSAHGLRRGDRVALMIPPGIDLSVVLYACWRIGAVPVLIDSGLGPRNMTKAMASAAPRALVGIGRALAAGRAFRWPGEHFSVSEITSRRGGPPPAVDVADDDPAALVFTSGSTGPSKGVLYTHAQLAAQRDALVELFEITTDDRLVAAFAPFALYGPALGIASVVPDMDVTAPGSLRADALVEAIDAVEATMVFASPAAFRNVVQTSAGLSPAQRASCSRVRVAMSAGAPVSDEVLESVEGLLDGATVITPYGMTEVLPIAATTLSGRRAAPAGVAGVCVGRPVAGVEVRVDALDRHGRPTGELEGAAGVLGELLVRAPHLKQRYDRLWWTEHRSSTPRGWHRTGDVGALSDDGQVFVAGRLQHVITTMGGPVAPVDFEHAAQRVPDIDLAAAVGVGPEGTQVVVVVVETSKRRGPLVEVDVIDAVRRAVAVVSEADVAAVLGVDELPTDRRHNAKIDRTRVATWASDVLAGGRVGRL